MIINLCPHSLKLIQYGEEVEIKSTGIARVSEQFVETGVVDGVVDGVTTYGEITGLPSPQEGVIYVVSAPTLDAATKLGRTDVRKPTQFVRNEKGLVLYAKAITRL